MVILFPPLLVGVAGLLWAFLLAFVWARPVDLVGLVMALFVGLRSLVVEMRALAAVVRALVVEGAGLVVVPLLVA